VHRRLAPLVGLVAILSGLALWLVAVPLASAGNPCFHGSTMPPSTSGTDTEIRLEPCSFAPTVTSVPVGTMVTFRNGTGFAHLITGANQAWGSPDVELQPSATVTHAFDAAGTYPYACALHPGMAGVIVVGEAAAAGVPPAAASTDGAATGDPIATSSTANVIGLLAIGAGVGVIVGAVITWAWLRRVRRGGEPLAVTT